MNKTDGILQNFRHYRRACFFAFVAAGIFLLWLCVPKPDLYAQYGFSSAVYDRNGKLMKLSLSMDDKYRLFVPYDELPPETVQALLLYEDRGFYYHFGVNPLSVIKAARQMMKGGRRRGASTVTMQVARMVYHIDSANILGKIKQMLRAVQIEMFYSKEQILEAYFNLAPYGGNIEGIGAAARIYFNRPVSQLNLPQILALTIIPQNPEKRSLLSIKGRQNNQHATKRLKEIWHKKYIHKENEYLDLPLAVGVHLPNEAPHLIRRLLTHHNGRIISTLDLDMQHQTEEILHNYVREQRQKGIYNAAALILDAETMETLAYIGSNNFNDATIEGQVDGITALRSPGSALKPFIYSLALEQGIIHPKTMLKDVPKNYGLYTPENFDRSFYGLVNATQALIHSRNIPAVDLLLRVGEENMYRLLEKCGVQKLKSPEFYGLAMALGGTEVSLENLTAMYAMLYNNGRFANIRLTTDAELKNKQLISPEAAFLTLSMLTENKAIDDVATGFTAYKQKYPVAWKTGTSYGFKDAWSIGVVGRFVVAVWVGNFDGTPNNAFVGREAAAPLFFRLVRRLARQNNIPTHLKKHIPLNLATVTVCQDTGDIAVDGCENVTETQFIPGVTNIKVSNVSRLIPIDVATGLRACRHLPPTTVMRRYNFWPSDVLQAYANAGIGIRRPPEFKENCAVTSMETTGKIPQIVAPANNSHFLVRSKKLKQEKIALKAITDADVKLIYWFINNKLIKEVKVNDVFEITPPLGVSEIKAVDDMGRMSAVTITVAPID